MHARSAVGVASLIVLMNWPSPAMADDAVDEVVVKATRSPVAVARSLADVTVLTEQDIQRSGALDLADLLSRQPGITFSNSGGPGTVTDVFVRGASTRFTALLIDGVRVDSQNLQGGAPWQGLSLAQIERVEIVRGGSGSALYGSDAVGGVVQIFTRGAAKKPLALSGGLAAGSLGTFKADATLSGRHAVWDYSMGFTEERSRGRSAISNPSNPNWREDRDSYDQSSVQARVGVQLTTQHRVEVGGARTRTQAGFDSQFSDESLSTTAIDTAQLLWKANWAPGLTAQYRLGESYVWSESASGGVFYTGTRTRTALIQHDVRWGEHNAQVILEGRRDRLDDGGDYGSSFTTGAPHREQTAFGFGYAWERAVWTLSANVRRDDDSVFGGHNTGAVGAAWRWAPGWSARINYSEGFRAPTLYELFAQYGGNASLQPETSRGPEAAVSWQNGPHRVSVTAYQQRISNLIEYSSSTFKYFNVSNARLQGLTLEARTKWGSTNWSASWDLQNPRNLDTGEVLVRRPRYHGNLAVDSDVKGWSLGAASRFVGHRPDLDGAQNAVRTGGYVTWGVFASKALTSEWQLSARVDNVFNKRYEVARDYSTPGTFAQLTLRYQPR
jgi:vitamin B12 transporter